MRKLALLGLLLLLPAAHALAQRGGFAGHGRGGFHSGFRARGFGFGHRGFSHHGYRGGFYRPSYGFGYTWPVYVGGYYNPFYSSFYGYSYPYTPPAVTVVNPEPAQPAPPVVITQQLTPAMPVIRAYQPPPEPAAREPEAGPVLYLIAFKSGVIRAALAYWTDGGTLHYVDMGRKQNQAALDTVDREFSVRLNRERQIPFRLP